MLHVSNSCRGLVIVLARKWQRRASPCRGKHLNRAVGEIALLEHLHETRMVRGSHIRLLTLPNASARV